MDEIEIFLIVPFKTIGFFKNLADESTIKAMQTFETCVSVNNSLCEKLTSSLKFHIKFDELFRVTSVSLFLRF